MKIKVFTAETMQEAMAQVKNALGRDAVILHTRRCRKGGFAGFFCKEFVEVTAAVDDTPPVQAPETKNTFIPIIPEQSPDQFHVKDELVKLKQMVGQLLKQNDAPSKTVWHDILLNNELEPEIADAVIRELPLDNPVIAGNQDIIKQLLKDKLLSYMPSVEEVVLKPPVCTKIAFIGSTGVGKTTTIAKLAAHFTLHEGKNLALIASDTYRIAAVEQLKTYADILGIPIDVVYTPSDLMATLAKYQDKDLVLIDTAGRSPHNAFQMQELADFLSVDATIEKYLVISSTTKYRDSLQTIEKFSLCQPQKLIFTKLDESITMGNIYNLIYRYNHLLLSYITTGQNVPDDIEIFNIEKLVDDILRN